jgi:hypothetical protein
LRAGPRISLAPAAAKALANVAVPLAGGGAAFAGFQLTRDQPIASTLNLAAIATPVVAPAVLGALALTRRGEPGTLRLLGRVAQCSTPVAGAALLSNALHPNPNVSLLGFETIPPRPEGRHEPGTASDQVESAEPGAPAAPPAAQPSAV